MEKNKQIKEFANSFLEIFVIIAFVVLIHTFVMEPVKVSGNSMYPTLHDKDLILIEKITTSQKKLERFDMIVFENKDDSEVHYVKRVIGLPGEKVQIQDGEIFVNDQKIEDYYGYEDVLINPGMAYDPVTLGPNQYFVLGDNRNHSSDSRFAEIGLVDQSQINGKLFFRLAPFGDFGSLKNQ